MSKFQPALEDPKHVGRLFRTALTTDLVYIDHNNIVKLIRRFRGCFDERLGFSLLAKAVLENLESWANQHTYTKKKLATEARYLLCQAPSKCSLIEEQKIGNSPRWKEHAVHKTRESMKLLLKKEQSEGININ